MAAWTWPCDLRAEPSPWLIVHFEPGKALLSASGKSELQKLFQSYAPGPQGRVFVVGYTDGTGAKSENRKLSLRRAQNVRREIIAGCKIDGRLVMASGKGAQTPLADNKTAHGRELNRRAEVFLANWHARKPPPAFGPGTPHWSEITRQVRDAEELIKARRMADALKELKQAHALGADRYARWHAVLGIAGYYANAALEQTRAHLVTALNLDPYNSEAREYLGRVDARLKVARAQVTKDMGRSPETAIAISDNAQQYEYLRLFEVEPQVHRVLEDQSVDMWQCMDRQGAPVIYYFNRAGVFQWALAGAVPSAGPTMAEDALIPKQIQSRSADAGMQPAPGDGPQRSGRQTQGAIWESKLFK